MTDFFIDIETIPGQLPQVMASILTDIAEKKAQISAPGNYKDEGKIQEYIHSKALELDNAAAQEYRNTGLDGARGQICCISLAINDGKPQAFYREDWQNHEAERLILIDFYQAISHEFLRTKSFSIPRFIGHNIINFDLRFIFQRSVILGIKPTEGIPFEARPWDSHVYDTCTKWAGVGNRVKLDKLCKVLGIAAKGSEIGEEIDGSQVWDYVQAGKIGKVAQYCNGDVHRTREVFRALTFTKTPVSPA
ncbi:MAG: hypothetical protein LBQ75_07240 [Zoogloeaceae bacterium]|jgi:hypothetical protein|nr:hypothetical protein [Zoogloeaceae bacterium]